MKRKRKKGQAGKIAPKPTRVAPQAKPTKKQSLISKILSIFCWFQNNKTLTSFCTLIGLCAAIATFYALIPKLQISPAGMLAETSAFSTQFEIKNDGYLAANFTDISCRIGTATFNNGHMSGIATDNEFHPNFPKLKTLKGGEKSSLPLDQEIDIGQGQSMADVTWSISYKICIVPFLGIFHYSQRFESKTNYAGNIVWNAVSEK